MLAAYSLKYLHISCVRVSTTQLSRRATLPKVLSEESNFDKAFLFGLFKLMRGVWIQIPPKAGHHRPAIETAFKWRFVGASMMACM